MAIQVLVGGYFFATIYNDDIASRNLTTIIGYGFSKTKIAISKLLTMTIVCLIIFAIVPIIMTILFNVFGASPAAGSLPIVYSIATKTLLSVVGYAAISSILAFGLARPVMAMVCYVLFAISLLDNLLIMVFTNGAIEPITGRLADLMMNRITSNIAEGLISSKGLVLPIVEYIVYLGIVIVASVLVFNKKEMEF
jgi:ABC-type transport system involved in multi-copper enzyme maturation permease subunit